MGVPRFECEFPCRNVVSYVAEWAVMSRRITIETLYGEVIIHEVVVYQQH